MCDCDNTDWIEYAHELESEVRTLQQRIVELERKLQLEEELHHTTESGYTELFATIEQQQKRIDELEAQLGKVNNKCVVYDLEPAQHESAIRDHLIKLGWTPPEGE